MAEHFSWGTFDDVFVDELAGWLRGSRVLEVFAGNGLLASLLAARDVDITATSLLTGHDGHRAGMHHEVIELDARSAIRDHGSEHDVLLMSWPPADEIAMQAALLWGEEKPLVFIGEITRPELGMMGLGGCASDLFFELTTETSAFDGYRSRKSGLDRAVVRHLSPGALDRWIAYVDERMSGRGLTKR